MARSFGATWWGAAWLEALEQGALADAGRLSRGRTYARQGKVFIDEVLPGLVTARVVGTDEYSADLSIKQITDEQWQTVVERIAARAKHAAALNSGELPVELEAELEAEGVHVLPRVGDLLGDCSCPDWGEPCKHVAALCYLIADLIDSDPFSLFLLRGRSRNDILRALRAERQQLVGASEEGGASAVPPSELAGVDGAAMYERTPAPLPSLAGANLGTAAQIMTQPPVDAGLDLIDLRRLADDASRRARQTLAGDGDLGLGLSDEHDAARRVAAAPADIEQLNELSRSLRCETEELAAWAIAWRHGGRAAVDVARTNWEPNADKMHQGRFALGAMSRVSGNTVTGGGSQLRLDRDGLWWRFAAHDSLGWIVDSTGFEFAADALE